MKLDELQDLFTVQLAELRSAETQLIDALPRMAAAASGSALRDLFLQHLEQTRRHRLRLDVIVRAVEAEVEVPDRDSEAMRSLICDVNEIAGCDGSAEVRDVALIAAARRIEHFEIASYETAGDLARVLYYGNAQRALHETMGDEHATDDRLRRLAAGGLFAEVGVHAMR